MIKKTISYQDYNGKATTEELYFHAPKHVLFDHLDLKEKFERVSESLEGDGTEREMTRDEVNDVLQLVKKLIRISYGVRTDGGRKFRQSEEIWAEFESSAAYDAFLWAMFQNPNDAFAFMRGIMPDDLVEQAQAQAHLDASGPKRPQDRQQKTVAAVAAVPTVSDNETVDFDEDTQLEEVVDAEAAIPAEVTGGESIEELEARLAAARAAQG